MSEAKLQNGDLVGTFRAPSTQGPFPGVLALGGSDGGTPEYFLNLLVPEGFACLAVAYWGTRDTQPTMVEIPLERLEPRRHASSVRTRLVDAAPLGGRAR